MYKVNLIYKPILSLIDLAGNIIFFPTKLKSFPREIRKILIIRLDHVGDAVMTTPVVKSLKMNYPMADVHVACRSLTGDVFSGNPNVSKVITVDAPWFSRNDFEGWSSFFGKISFLRKERYDLIIELHADPRNIILASLIGGYRVGYDIRGFGFLLNKVARYDNAEKHNIERNLDVLRSLNLVSLSTEPELFVSKENSQKIRKFLGNGKFVCINPGTGRQEKYWLKERWAGLCSRIEKSGFKLLFTGSPDDQKLVDEIILASGIKTKNYINIVGRTSLSGLAAAIKQCKLFIGPDTGPMHIARAVRTPLIGLFGPVDPNVWGYNDTRYKNIWKPRMSDITVDDVFNVAKRMLK